ncbi:sulfur carrier protein ThiS [Fictibacillus fluitans]|uniref:Sulfur carrier protein ThiS n=1 Tax=Fictibacillus fluitans TaxID=3058422 RepID=A0ABT8HUD0_9BACL|nr:sulfur carrier protein ThiS [Fictibacillus sp. NE201]MDN4524371.1 sulfur carrier protein ThiS [Fictibacillus sp. NE201]
MKLVVNGNTMEVAGVQTVGDLIKELKLAGKGAIVELNEEILSKSEHAEAVLANGDKVEIVHFVGGG